MYFIKNKNVKAHRNAIYTSMILSGLFLLSYVVYHFTNEAVKFGDANFDGEVDATELAAVGSTRIIYLILLIVSFRLALLGQDLRNVKPLLVMKLKNTDLHQKLKNINTLCCYALTSIKHFEYPCYQNK